MLTKIRAKERNANAKGVNAMANFNEHALEMSIMELFKVRSLGADEFYIQQIKNKIIEVKARKVKESKLYYKLAKKIFTKNMVNNDHILDNI